MCQGAEGGLFWYVLEEHGGQCRTERWEQGRRGREQQEDLLTPRRLDQGVGLGWDSKLPEKPRRVLSSRMNALVL